MNLKLTIVFLLFVIPSCFTHAQSDKKTDGSASKQTDKQEKQTFSIADGMFQFEAPGDWKKVKPKFDFYDAEFQIPKSEGDEKNGRITFSRVGGSIDQNLERWVGQFVLEPDDENAVEKKSKTIDGVKVQLIKISGTFKESAGGPMGPKTNRENYLLYGAAIDTGTGRSVYIKAYGPKKTMSENEKHLRAMIEGMKAVDG